MRYCKVIRLLFIFALAIGSSSIASVCNAIKLPQGTIKGQLSNGLSYIIKRNAHPRNTTEFRLVMRIGALQQTDAQGGTAHFLEHMAFAGSKSYHGFSMVHALEGKGMKFGRDINAYTSFDKTIYSLSVPTQSNTTNIRNDA